MYDSRKLKGRHRPPRFVGGPRDSRQMDEGVDWRYRGSSWNWERKNDQPEVTSRRLEACTRRITDRVLSWGRQSSRLFCLLVQPMLRFATRDGFPRERYVWFQFYERERSLKFCPVIFSDVGDSVLPDIGLSVLLDDLPANRAFPRCHLRVIWIYEH